MRLQVVQWEGLEDGGGFESGLVTCELSVVHVTADSSSSVIHAETIPCNSTELNELRIDGLALTNVGGYAISIRGMDAAGNRGCPRRTDDGSGQSPVAIAMRVPAVVGNAVVRDMGLGVATDADYLGPARPAQVGCDWGETSFDEAGILFEWAFSTDGLKGAPPPVSAFACTCLDLSARARTLLAVALTCLHHAPHLQPTFCRGPTLASQLAATRPPWTCTAAMAQALKAASYQTSATTAWCEFHPQPSSRNPQLATLNPTLTLTSHPHISS